MLEDLLFKFGVEVPPPQPGSNSNFLEFCHVPTLLVQFPFYLNHVCFYVFFPHQIYLAHS